MHTVTFHNLGNADSILVDLSNGRRTTFDYADMRCADDEDDLRCDLPEELREALGDDDFIDVVAFTHLDRDHYNRATEFFHFDHVKAHQGEVDGKPRIEMNVIWVPAAVITEKLTTEENTEEARTIQKEARERFKAGKGIRVFSRPERLRDWCQANGIDLEKRCNLITDAGQLAPEFTLADDDAEFFVHSPFAVRQDECTVEDRNNHSIVMQLTLRAGGSDTRVMLTSDVCHHVFTDIVTVTESKGNKLRLEWDIFKLPHHCSYTALGPEKGDEKTKPEPKVKRLFEHYAQDDCIVVSTSWPIPEPGSEDDECDDPPHRQAAKYYRDDVTDHLLVTMEHPSKKKPKPLVIEIDENKATIRSGMTVGAMAAVSFHSPRAG